jgi:hypothetical protein
MSFEGEFENTEDARDDETALAPSDDEEVPEALAQLHNFVSNLELTEERTSDFCCKRPQKQEMKMSSGYNQ